MFTWLSANIGTIVVALVLVLIVALVVRYVIKEKRAGHSFCAGTSCGGGGCSGKCELCHGCDFPKDIKIRKSPNT